MSNNPTKNLKTNMILDVGAGEGDSCVLLSKEGASVVSLDCDLEMLKEGVKKKKILKGYAVLADARYIPFKDCSFDMVSSRYLLHCVKAYVECLREMKRLIKPEGNIQIIDICAPVQEIREFLQKCHHEKSPPLACCGILTKNELLHQLNKLGVYVQFMEWSTLKEKE
jgi:ubiquinone/menaquinone biosynthesis C-methylase UbiE